MAKRVQWIGHITAAADEFIGREREITVDTQAKELRLHDGATAGGHRFLALTALQQLFQPLGSADFNSITVDTIDEFTGNAGVTVDGVLIKDGEVDGVDVSALETEVLTNIPADIAVVQFDINAHEALTNNPHAVTKTQVGLANVTNDAQLKIASNLSDLADAATARTNLGLGSLATKSTIVTGDITDGTIVNADIGAAAAIALSKLATQAAESVVMNATGGAAVPTAVTLSGLLDVVSNTLNARLRLMINQDRKANGTSGGTTVANAWTKLTCDDNVVNNITSASENASVVTLPAGDYLFLGFRIFYNNTTGFKSRIQNTTDGTTVAQGFTQSITGANMTNVCIGFASISAAKNFEFQYMSAAVTTDGLGRAVAPSTEEEVYGTLVIIKIG